MSRNAPTIASAVRSLIRGSSQAKAQNILPKSVTTLNERT